MNHQAKLMDSKCRLSAKPDAQISATSCLILLGPLTRTPRLNPSISISISATNYLVELNRIIDWLYFRLTYSIAELAVNLD